MQLWIGEKDIPERKTLLHNFALITDGINLFSRFSSFIKLQRVIAYCLRFKENSLGSSKNIGNLSAVELKKAFQRLVLHTQLQSFARGIQDLKHSKTLHTSNRMLSLNPYLDEEGVLRVGGRLRHADINYEENIQLYFQVNIFSLIYSLNILILNIYM